MSTATSSYSKNNENKDSMSYKWPYYAKDYVLKQLLYDRLTTEVRLSFCLRRQKYCAVKILHLKHCYVSAGEFFTELKNMLIIRDAKIIPYYSIFFHKVDFWMAMEYMKDGSVGDLLDKVRKYHDVSKGYFPEPFIAKIIKDVIEGVQVIHGKGLIHHALKCSNFFIKDNGQVILSDYGISGWFSTSGELHPDSKGRRFYPSHRAMCWMAPEVITNFKRTSSKSDIWSLGICVIEMVAGKPPFYARSNSRIIESARKNEIPTLNSMESENLDLSSYSPYIHNFVSACLNRNPDKRPSLNSLLEHPFLKSESVGSVIEDFQETIEKEKKLKAETNKTSSTSAPSSVINFGYVTLNDSDQIIEPIQRSNVYLANKRLKSLDPPLLSSKPTMMSMANPTNKSSKNVYDEESILTVQIDVLNPLGKKNKISFYFDPAKDNPKKFANWLLHQGYMREKDHEPLIEYMLDIIQKHWRGMRVASNTKLSLPNGTLSINAKS